MDESNNQTCHKRFGSCRNVASVASINTDRVSGGRCKPTPVGAGEEPKKISNFRLFQALKQAFEIGVKTLS